MAGSVGKRSVYIESSDRRRRLRFPLRFRTAGGTHSAPYRNTSLMTGRRNKPVSRHHGRPAKRVVAGRTAARSPPVALKAKSRAPKTRAARTASRAGMNERPPRPFIPAIVVGVVEQDDGFRSSLLVRIRPFRQNM